MKKIKNISLCLSFTFALFFISEAKAQVFDSQATAQPQKKETVTSETEKNIWFRNPRTSASQTANSDKTKASEADWATPKKEEPYIPQQKRPTLDGVKRGHVSMVPIVSEKDKKVEDRFIFVYYSNFNIRSSMSGRVMCDVKFIVLSTLDRRINNLSIRLKWPKMETGLNYEGIAPNTETYYNYTLLGEGCYSMDSIPNIVVNRCRVKGMSSQECASKIKWLRKQ